MRLLVTLFSPVSATFGGLTRMVAIAEAASKAGHDIAFCTAGAQEAKLRARGYKVYTIPQATMFGLPRPISRVIERRSQETALPVKQGRSVGSIWFVHMLSGYARAGYLRRLLDAQKYAALDFKANVLLTDIDPGAYMLAYVLGLPLASTYQNVMTQGKDSFAWKLMRRAMDTTLKANGKMPRDPHQLFFDPSVLKIVPSIPELDGADPARPDVCYVGHLLGDVQQQAAPQGDPGRRYTLVYVGTGSIPLDKLRKVLPVIFPDGGRLHCLVGAQSIETPEHYGAVDIQSYIPVEALLPQSEWVICHGGQNTIIQALRRDVPLLIFPGPIFERRFNAERVQAAGAGKMGEIDDFNADWLNQALAQQAEFTSAARELGQKIRALGGADAAIRALEKLHQK